ncbi:peroxin 22 [Klebsormidium nitens]|uniref:Peroxin 22 n=1 Tax=Klebsormidium nitens TaxID=105231 RepID=A0A1Y1HU00_KLENI|nr:peroxin 22 [Klebsormidium nitens]|eukprot:GAQ82100.1 peroxin 22 [Klebsormidium nitens]
MDDLINALADLGGVIAARVSKLLAVLSQNKNASSWGAVAGLALAIICAWRYIGKGRDSPRLRKHEGVSRLPPEAESHFARASGVSHSATQATHRGKGVEQTVQTQPAQMTLAQSVHHRLQGSRRMTLTTLGVLFTETSPEEVQENGATLRPGAAEVVKELSKACDLYLVTQCLDDTSEIAVMSALESAGLFAHGAVNKDKVLFCSTPQGRASFVRQLEPDWHVDTSADIIKQLARFVQHQLHIASGTGPRAVGSGVVAAEGLAQYFGKSATVR